MVDLLSRHLYSSPRVYLRELLQNGVDAVTARRAEEPDAPARIHIETPEHTGEGSLRVHDTGVGLTEPQIHELLATIGRSSKRDELGYARHEFLGQFGIGLLSGFLVADEIEVLTRSMHGGPTIRWVGYSDGRYLVEEAEEERNEVGTTVILRPRRDAEEWFAASTVANLARHYGAFLPVELRVGDTLVTEGEPPWRRTYPTPVRRRAALADYCQAVFGFAPLDVIDLEAAAAGLRGVAFVLPHAANPTVRAAHRVYLKRMLLADNVTDLLPEWAFFVRCVVDAEELRPTANREALYDDDLLGQVCDTLGEQIRDWLLTLAHSRPEELRRFLQLHHVGVKALAAHDDTMLDLVYRWLDFETSSGTMPWQSSPDATPKSVTRPTSTSSAACPRSPPPKAWVSSTRATSTTPRSSPASATGRAPLCSAHWTPASSPPASAGCRQKPNCGSATSSTSRNAPSTPSAARYCSAATPPLPCPRCT